MSERDIQQRLCPNWEQPEEHPDKELHYYLFLRRRSGAGSLAKSPYGD